MDSEFKLWSGNFKGWIQYRKLIPGENYRGTVSQSIGCFLKQDFQAKPYAAKEGKCDKSIPFPLPKFDK